MHSLLVTGFIGHTVPAGLCCVAMTMMMWRVCVCVSLQVNPEVVPELEKHGLHFVGQDETQKRMEIMELPGVRGERAGGRDGRSMRVGCVRGSPTYPLAHGVGCV